MRIRRCVVLTIAIALISQASMVCIAQDIALGTWRTHLSYHNINTIAFGNQKVFAAGNLGVVVLDQTDNSISTYSKINGLNGTRISYIDYDVNNDQLLITYVDGGFDVVVDELEIIGFDPTKNSTLAGSKKINHALIADGIAYLSADYGVIVFDMTRMLVKETWRGLGNAGQDLKIFQSAILGDSIFLATGKGVIAGALNDNLQDFNNWKRFETDDLNGPVEHIANFNNSIYSAVNFSGIYKHENAQWIKTPFLQGSSYRSINSSGDNLYVAEESGLFRLTAANNFSQVIDQSIKRPTFASDDASGKLWIGDATNGLITNVSGSFVSTIPNSPSSDKIVDLTYHDKAVHAVAGGYSSNGVALGNPGVMDSFRDGLWDNEESASLDLTSIAFDEGAEGFYISSFGYGVEARDGQGNATVYDETNSPLVNTNPPGKFVSIPALASGLNGGVWIANYASPKPLHFLGNDKAWRSFSFPFDQSKYPLKLAVDLAGSVWIGLDPMKGGGILVFNEVENSSVLLTEESGSGGLPSKSANAMTIDRNGSVWIGTDLGVAYFNQPASVFSGDVNAIKPIFDGRFLLRDDKVTAIAVDGGNRKWIGTERGLWLFNESGEELIYNFTADNSPLISNVIRDLAVNGETGEVFIATDEGLLSFRSDATEGTGAFGAVKVFPNPVTADFVGSIGITGLATDALVKITDVNGKLVWQTRANGGSASWNLQDVNGRRPSTGVYIVFAVTDDGQDNAVAKIAFVD